MNFINDVVFIFCSYLIFWLQRSLHSAVSVEYENYKFANYKIKLQKIKTISFMKLTVVTTKQSISVNLNSLNQTNKKDLSGIAIAKRMRLESNHNFSWDQKKIVDRKSRLICRKIKETVCSLKNLNHINKIYMLPEIWVPNLR